MNKSVTFSSVIKCRPTLSRFDLTEDERENTWRSTADRQTAQDEALVTVRVMRGLLTFNGEIHPDAEAYLVSQGHTLRGIEHLRSQRSTALRRHRRMDMVDSVLEKQFYHYHPHNRTAKTLTQHDLANVSISLAEISMAKSMKARTEAAARGQSDAEWARVINEVEDMVLDNNSNNQYNESHMESQLINCDKENIQQAMHQQQRADDAAGKGKRNSRLLDRVGCFIRDGVAKECKQVASISA